jgi:hypothetical protein
VSTFIYKGFGETIIKNVEKIVIAVEQSDGNE